MPRLASLERAGEFEVRVETLRGGGSVVRVTGELDMATSSELESELERANAGERVVVDLTECTFLDSTALRVLLAGASRSEAGGGALELVAPDERVRRVLEIAGVETKIPIHATLDALS